MVCLEIKKLDKEHLREEFSKDYHKYYSTELFKSKGFARRKCSICAKHFWSIMDRETCDDPEHTEYSFFKDKTVKLSYTEMWKKFSAFFKGRSHEEIARYPVVSRWRQDLYFTIASIQDFQRIENGNMSFEYSANPLIVPQICLRFSDLENVGITGRHLTSFMMAGQHAFDYPKHGYWRDDTISLNYEFLTKVLNVKDNDLVYSEDAWAMGDFSEFGPCLESFSNGLELVNSVFTQFEYTNNKISELDSKVVDVGWGFERLLWFYTGYDNIYEATFSNILEKVEKKANIDFDRKLFKKFAALSSELDVTEKGGKTRELEIVKKAGLTIEDYNKKVKPLQALYAVLDHSRTLLFAISDGALPSNIGGGYNLRVMLRRAMGFISEYNLGIEISEIAEMHARDLKEMYPDLSDNIDLFDKVVDIEKSRYEKSRQNAGKIVDTILAKKKKIDAKELATLYESNGITPELITSVAEQKGTAIEMPESNYKDILKGDFAAREKIKKVDIDVSNIPKTKQLYYDFISECDARVLKVEKNYIVLDKTVFYPDGGGQAAETGIIEDMEVADVQKVGDVIVHIMRGDVARESNIKDGSLVKCVVNMERRNRLMAHHTATHLMSAAARNVLGKHAWQEGTRKEEDKAHIDVSHYDKLTKEEVELMEDFVNNAIANGITVKAEMMNRGEAEKQFGFAIYQGHGVPAKKMRIVTIEDKDGKIIDAEACGGMHVIGRESLIGIVKIISASRIHDGVDRLEYVAGDAALDYFGKEDNELTNISRIFNTEKFGVSMKVDALRDSNSEMIKELDSIAEIASDAIASQYAGRKEEEIEIELPKANRALMRKAAEKIAKGSHESSVLIFNKNFDVVCVSAEKSKVSSIDRVKKRFGSGFKGGGNEKIAEGKIVDVKK